MPYDTSCFDLAQRFLPDGIDDKIISELSQEIQDTIESFIYYGEHKDRIAELEQEANT